MAKKKKKKKAKASTKRVKAKRATKKAAKKVARKPAKKAVKKARPKRVAKAAVKPKLPRRTQAAAPTRVSVPPPMPVIELPPVPPPFPPAPPGGGLGGMTEPTGGTEGSPTDQMPAGPQVGDRAPEFQLSDETGRVHSLWQYRGQKVVLYFYPKDDTPGCTKEACGFRDTLGSFADRKAVVLGVSPDPVASHQRFAQKYGLTFPLLADTDHAVAERYGVWVPKGRAGTKLMGIARTTFVIDESGCVARLFRDVRPQGHEQEVLASL